MRSEKTKCAPEKLRASVRAEAEGLIGTLIAEAKLPVLRTMAWTLHKAFKGLFDKININMEMI